MHPHLSAVGLSWPGFQLCSDYLGTTVELVTLGIQGAQSVLPLGNGPFLSPKLAILPPFPSPLSPSFLFFSHSSSFIFNESTRLLSQSLMHEWFHLIV